MDRRVFLKRIAGFSLGLASVGVSIPTSAKCKVVAPVSDLIAENFSRRKESSLKFKKSSQNNPNYELVKRIVIPSSQTATFPVRQLMERSASHWD